MFFGDWTVLFISVFMVLSKVEHNEKISEKRRRLPLCFAYNCTTASTEHALIAKPTNW